MTARVEKESKPLAWARGMVRATRRACLGAHLVAAASIALASASPAQAQSGGRSRPKPGATSLPDNGSTPAPATTPDDAPATKPPGPSSTPGASSAPASTPGSASMPAPASTSPAGTPGPAATPPLANISAAAVAAPAGATAPWSQGVAIRKRQTAREVFLAANELARKRFFATAAAQYKQAIEIWPHPAFFYNLAVAQLQLEQPVEAHANLQRGVEHGPDPLDGRYIQARQQLALLESELSPIEVSCAEPGAQVMLDGKLLFTAPGRHRGIVRPGTHQLVATRRGLTPVVEQIVVAPGERGSFALTFEYPEIAVSTRPWPAWRTQAVIGTSAALLLAGGVLDWHSTRMFNEYNRRILEKCPLGCRVDALPPGLDELESRANTEQRAALISYAAGSTVLATGVVLAYLGRERTIRRRVRPPLEPGPEASIGASTLTPLITPDIIGASVGLRF